MRRHRTILAVVASCTATILSTLLARQPDQQDPSLEAWAIHEACRDQLATQLRAASDAAQELGSLINAQIEATTPLLRSMDSRARTTVGGGMIRIGEANQDVLRRLLVVYEGGKPAETVSWKHLQQESGISDLPTVECPEVKR